MHWISQRYAIRLDKLLERNLMDEGIEPATGEIIFLKNKRDKMPLLRDSVVILIAPSKVVGEVAVMPLVQDTQYNQKVYDNAVQNIETQEPIEVVGEDTSHDFKENLSFFHTVQSGETLYGIGKKYGIRVDAIQYLNLLQGDSISVGQRLIINPAITSADTKEPQSTAGMHVVRQGETLFSIAKQYGLKPADIMATNNLSNNKVFIGQKLVVVKKAKSGKQ
jgi:LysM repeat protein